MTISYFRRLALGIPCLLYLSFLPSIHAANLPQVFQQGYSIRSFGAETEQINGIATDPLGRLLVLTSNNVVRYSPTGSREVLAAGVRAYHIAVGPDGYAYLATRLAGRSILRLSPAGETTTFIGDSNQVNWTWIAFGGGGEFLGVGQESLLQIRSALYQIDAGTGRFDAIAESYWSFREVPYAFGVFSSAFSPPLSVGLLTNAPYRGVYEFNAKSRKFGRILELPFHPLDLATDKSGVIYATYDREAYLLDRFSKRYELFLQGDIQLAYVAYDFIQDRLFVAEQFPPYRIYSVSIPQDACVRSTKAVLRTSEFEVSWSGQTNHLYAVEYRSEATTNQWLRLASGIRGTGSALNIWTDRVPADEPRRFYRVLCDNPAGVVTPTTSR